MEGLVIGDKGCKISEVIATIKKSTVIGQLNSKLFQVAMSLDTPSDLKSRLRTDIINFGSMSHLEGLEKILEEWKSRDKKKATLVKFIEVLEDDDLNEFAELLKDRFENRGGSNVSSSGGASTGSSQGAEMIRKQKAHIQQILPQLIEMTTWNASLISGMQAKGILGRADVKTLDDTPQTMERTRLFFTFIHDRLEGNPQAYNQVIAIFDELKQSGIIHLLRKVYE